MKDTLDTNLPAENAGKLENETASAELTECSMDTANNVAETNVAVSKLTKEEIIDKLSQIVENPEEASRNEVETLKQAFYRIRRNEVDDLKKEFLENGGEEKDFIVPENKEENTLKSLLAEYKTKRAAIMAEDERIKNENYTLKLQLIDQLKALCESQDDFNKLYNDFKDIQQRWKEIQNIPQEHVNDLWKSYQNYSEKFYDIIKINNQFRDYDFKKNLEMKTALCETVEKLQNEEDVISAFYQLQKLHQQWREIGPVAKELRESLWSRFKAASTAINKRHQHHFETLKAKEQDNLAAKTAICEEIESIDFNSLKSYKDWDDMSKVVLELQDKWKTIGFAPKKHNVKIFERFRAACDNYFNRKTAFYKQAKAEMDSNLAKKRELCEKAEALKDSTDWKATTEKLIALQKEWKTVGSVSRKYSDSIWKRFITACDYFFDQKEKNTSSQKVEERENLAKKKSLIAKIKELIESEDTENSFNTLKELMAEWNKTGHVPFKEKDKIYTAYHDAVNALYDKLKISKNDRRMQTFRNNVNDIVNGERSKNKLYSEREKLMRMYDRIKNELHTYENNIGFLSISSKGGNGLIKEMERKIEKLKDEMDLIVKKIDTIDENLE